MKLASLLCSCHVIALGWALPAQAQVDTGPDQEDVTDIVVTGTRKAGGERLQRAPVSVSALGEEQLQRNLGSTISDVAMMMPNTRLQTVGSLPGVANFSIRGMGFNSSIASEEPTVGVVVDGVYLANNFGAVVDNFDLEALEVLRGPQGTLFGRNVTAGVVSIRSKRPTGEYGFSALANVGSGGRMDAAVAIEAPITDTIAMRVSTAYKSQDGFFGNRARPGHPVDFRRDVVVRPTLSWRPDNATRVTLLGQYNRNRDGGNTGRASTPIGTYRPPTQPGVLDQDAPSYSNQDIRGATLEIERTIGNGVLTSVLGYRNVRYDASIDADGTPVQPASIQDVSIRQHQWSEELRYAGSIGDRFDFTVGVQGFSQKLRTAYLLQRASPLIAAGRLSELSLGAFTQVEWKLADTVSVIGGARYSYVRKAVQIGRGFTPVGDCNRTVLPTVGCTLAFHDTSSWQDVSPKVGLNWQATEDMLAYVSVSRGFRSGGYNLRNYATNAPYGPYQPETVTAGELGLKRSFGKRARINGAVFYNRYDDLLRTAVSGTGITAIINAASATIYGAELDASFAPVDGLRLDATVGYVNASYRRFDRLDLTGDGVPDPAQARRLRLERAPRWTWSLAGSYDLYTGPSGTISTSATYSYTGEQPVNTANAFFLGDYRLLDAALRWRTADEHLTLSLYGRNLTNKIYAATGYVLNVGGRYLEPPRNYGVEGRFNF